MHPRHRLLLGAAAALTASPAVAAVERPPAVTPAVSYADLLTPIPNAVEKLRASDAEIAAQPPRLERVQYVAHHHHHHHHHHSRRWYLQNGYVWSGGGWILRPRPHHHHHHHHNHY